MSARDEEWRESRMCRKGMREGERKEKIEGDLNTKTAKKQSSIVGRPIVWARRKGDLQDGTGQRRGRHRSPDG